MNIVIREVCDEFNLTLEQIRMKTRKQLIVRPRHIGMFLSREFCSQTTLLSISRYFGMNDHTAANYACKTIDNQCMYDSKFKDIIDRLRNNIAIEIDNSSYDFRHVNKFALSSRVKY